MILLNSWRSGTKQGYEPYIKQWLLYAQTHQLNQKRLMLWVFCTHFLIRVCSYIQINTARSALSAVFNLENSISWGKLPIVPRFMKGIFEARPLFPNYHSIWDVSNVFNFFRQLPAVEDLNLKILSHKLALLISLLSGGQRCQTIHAINIKDIYVVENILVIPIMDVIKQTKAGKHKQPLKFKAYSCEPQLCVATHMLVYLQKTEALRTSASLFIGLIKPHSAVCTETISRWCKDILRTAGVNTNKYTSHSSRSAASSKDKTRGFTLLACQANGHVLYLSSTPRIYLLDSQMQHH